MSLSLANSNRLSMRSIVRRPLLYYLIQRPNFLESGFGSSPQRCDIYFYIFLWTQLDSNDGFCLIPPGRLHSSSLPLSSQDLGSEKVGSGGDLSVGRVFLFKKEAPGATN